MRWFFPLLLVCTLASLLPKRAEGAPAVQLTAPTRTVLAPGGNVTLSVNAEGVGPVSFHWFRQGRLIGGATNPTLALTQVDATAVGWYVVDATDANGTTRSQPFFVIVAPQRTQIRAWGDNYYGQLNIPPDLTDAVAIAAGSRRALAVRRDGTVVSWGRDPSTEWIKAPADLTDVVDLAADDYDEVIALKSDGTIVVFNSPAPPPAGLSNIVQVACSGDHFAALKSDGTVVAWGNNSRGQTQVPAGLTGVVSIAAGSGRTFALKGDGTVVGWGYETDAMPALADVVEITAASYTTFARKADGSIVAWGSPYGNELDFAKRLGPVSKLAAKEIYLHAILPDGTVQSSWMEGDPDVQEILRNLGTVWALASGGQFAVALRDATSDVPPTVRASPSPVTVIEGQKVVMSAQIDGTYPLTYQWRRDGVSLAEQTGPSLVIPNARATDAGSYDAVVTNHLGTVTTASATVTINPLVGTISSETPSRRSLLPGEMLDLAVTATGKGALTYQWVRNGKPIPGATGARYTCSQVTRSDAGWYVLLVTDESGTRRSPVFFVDVSPAYSRARSWGRPMNSVDGLLAARLPLASVSMGENHVLARYQSGTLQRAGVGYNGLDTMPAGLTDIAIARAGPLLGMAVRADGTLLAWGGVFTEDRVPAGLTDIVDVAAGYGFAVALRSDGHLFQWGSNLSAQPPVELQDVVGVAAGDRHALALRANGTVVAWGFNTQGQTDVPADLGNVIAITASYETSFALKRDGTVIAWGGNSAGERTIPTSLHDVEAISASGAGRHVLALQRDGTLVAWGSNANGQTTIPAGVGRIWTMAAGGAESIALWDASDYTAPVITEAPSGREVAEDALVIFTASASGDGPITYQWNKDGVPISGATGTTYTIARVKLTDAGNYTVTAHNHLGDTTSAPAQLTVNPLPVVVLTASTRHALLPGDSFQLSVTATGAGPLTYQWVQNGWPLSGETGPSLNRTNVNLAASGWYAARVTDAHGTRTSAPFFVIVAPAVTRVRAWGQLSPGFERPPIDLTDLVSVAAGSSAWIGLRRTGELWNNIWSAPTGTNNVVRIAAHGGSYMAVKSNGTVVAWGDAESGHTWVPAGLTNVVEIAFGGRYGTALKSDGTIVGWGLGWIAPPVTLKNAIAIAAGSEHMLALRADGTIVGWGRNTEGQITIPAGLNDVSAIAATGNTSLAIRRDGTVVAWGENYADLLNFPTGLIAGGIAAQYRHALALTRDGRVVGWGAAWWGESTVPANLDRVLAVSTGVTCSIALRDGTNDTLPAISVQPVGVRLTQHGTVSLSVTATGTGNLRYQWQINEGGGWSAIADYTLAPGYEITGSQTANLTFNTQVYFHSGRYRCLVTDEIGGIASQEAVIAIVFGRPIIVSSGTLTATVGQPLIHQIYASNSPTSYSLNWTSGNPGPTQFDTSLGKLTLTPNQPGTYPFTATATNELGTGTLTGTLTVQSLRTAWTAANFNSTERADQSISGPNADPDGDGLANLLEYALGTNPWSANTPPAASTDAVDWLYTYTRPSGQNDLSYEVEVSDNLISWTTAGVLHERMSTDGSTETWRARCPLAAAPCLFFRLKITAN